MKLSFQNINDNFIITNFYFLLIINYKLLTINY